MCVQIYQYVAISKLYHQIGNCIYKVFYLSFYIIKESVSGDTFHTQVNLTS
jgi:hypothetical protein